MRIWRATDGAELRQLTGNPQAVTTLTFLPDQKTLLAECAPFSGRCWDITTGQALPPLERPKDFPEGSYVISEDGQRMIVRSFTTKSLGVFDLATRKPVGISPMSYSAPYTMSLSPNGQLLATLDRGAGIQIWDTATGREVSNRPGLQGDLNHCAVSPDGRETVSTDANGMIRFWETATGKEVRQWRMKPNENPDAIAFSPDGVILAVTIRFKVKWGERAPNPVRVCWKSRPAKKYGSCRDTSTAAEVHFSPPARPWLREVRKTAYISGRSPLARNSSLIGEQEKIIRAVAVSPDGSLVALGGHEFLTPQGQPAHRIRVWNLITGKLQVAILNTDVPTSLAFASDSRLLASGGSGLRLWDAMTGREVRCRKREWLDRPVIRSCFLLTVDCSSAEKLTVLLSFKRRPLAKYCGSNAGRNGRLMLSFPPMESHLSRHAVIAHCLSGKR